MVDGRFEVTDLLRARRATRPPTWLFVLGVVAGWLLDAALGWWLATIGVSGVVVALVVVLGYLALPPPIVLGLRRAWLRSNRDRVPDLEVALAEVVPRFSAWVDEQLGGPADVPYALAGGWLLGGVTEAWPLPPELASAAGGLTVTARHVQDDGRTWVRLDVPPYAPLTS